MNIGMIVAEAVIFAILFTIMEFIMAIKKKNTPSNIHNYPKDIQDE